MPARSSGYFIIADEVSVCSPISGGHIDILDTDYNTDGYKAEIILKVTYTPSLPCF